jgi:hypothetical protein
MEEPEYADINAAELREIEAELGRPVSRELAQWFIRNRINREAVERMLQAAKTNRMDPNIQHQRPASLVKKQYA